MSNHVWTLADYLVALFVPAVIVAALLAIIGLCVHEYLTERD